MAVPGSLPHVCSPRSAARRHAAAATPSRPSSCQTSRCPLRILLCRASPAQAPVVLRNGKNTVEDFCNALHKSILKDMK